MIIDRNIRKFVVLSNDTILNALNKISSNKKHHVFTVYESGGLEGVLTDGDFRRWLVQQDEIDLHRPVSLVSNKDVVTIQVGEEDKLLQTFNLEINVVPIVDALGRLVAVALKESDEIRIGPFHINEDSQTFIIAEIGNNHNGSLEYAKRLVDSAALSGANCAKFQARHMSALYHNAGDNKDNSEDLGSQYVLDLLSRFQLSDDDLFRVFDYCKSKDILPLCTPWDIPSLEKLESYGMEAYKVASADLTNHELLMALAHTRKPLLCSTGMATDSEIKESVALLGKHGVPYVLLHCNSTYPAPYKDVHLRYIKRLKKMGNCPVGYSGHERGFHIPLAAVTVGAKVIEKHFTLDRSMEGNDHKISLLPDEFKTMVTWIRDLEEAMGSGKGRKISQGELINRENLAKSMICNRDLEPGDVVTEEMIQIRSPGRGLQPNRKNDLLGRCVKRSIRKGGFFFQSDLEDEEVKPRPYQFRRPWGLPCRFHDFKNIISMAAPNHVEFHLSYNDLELDIHQFLDGTYPLDFVVHSPELFKGDHLLDLCSNDPHYCRHSIQELQRVIDLTRSMKSYFPKTERPFIIVNVGGFTNTGHMSPSMRGQYYDILRTSLLQLDRDGVELLPQSMPPFPWHFGGQQFHNLFVDPHEMATFCKDNHLRICLDTSHSKLAATYFKWSIMEFIEIVGPVVAYLHIADASGSDGEGLQIGEGEVDFMSLGKTLRKVAPNAPFIPEIWQGHKNGCEGFWIALDRLERWL